MSTYESELQAEIQKPLRELAAPLRAQLDEINERIERAQAELAALRSARSQIDQILQRLEPEPGKQPKQAKSAATRRQRLNEKILNDVLAFIERHPERLVDGFTRTQLVAWMRAEDPATGTRPETAGPVFDELRDRGLIRADRKVRGGGLMYKLTGNGDGP